MANLRRVTPDELRGRRAISYLRFSSSPQERGSAIDRQQEVLDRATEFYGLVVDQTLTDRALSASKGHHRTKGKLADLIAAVDHGDVPHGAVLIVEAADRLFREGILDVFPILAGLIVKGRMILVIGNDLTIYCEAAINGDLSHKLVAEINAARDYAKRLGEMASGAHRSRRRRVEAFAADPDKAIVPTVNGILPAWITRTKGQNDYTLHEGHTATLRTIFNMCAEGASVRQITDRLTADGATVFPGMKSWRHPRVGAILRDRHAIGMYTPTRKGKTYKRDAIGSEVKIFVSAQPPFNRHFEG